MRWAEAHCDPAACTESCALSDGGESASLGSAFSTFLLYPAERVVEACRTHSCEVLQWVGYSIGLPLIGLAMPFATVGAGDGPEVAAAVDKVHRDGRTIADGGGHIMTFTFTDIIVVN